MDFRELIQRKPKPEPWEEGDNIPWNEPGFSERMLSFHLSQENDAASRRFTIIDRHVAWIHQFVLGDKPARILDLGCGPGLYSSRLAQLGHTCVGIDWSPASIRYASQFAQEKQLACTYIESDVRQAPFGAGFDLAMFIFGEFNVFKPADASLILDKACQALKPGGRLLLEVHTFDAIRRMGLEPASWYTSQGALFSSQPYLALEEAFWDEGKQVATRRYFVIDSAHLEITRYAASYQAYSDEGYRSTLQSHNFQQVSFIPGMTGEVEEHPFELFVILAEKK